MRPKPWRVATCCLCTDGQRRRARSTLLSELPLATELGPHVAPMTAARLLIRDAAAELVLRETSTESIVETLLSVAMKSAWSKCGPHAGAAVLSIRPQSTYRRKAQPKNKSRALGRIHYERLQRRSPDCRLHTPVAHTQLELAPR